MNRTLFLLLPAIAILTSVAAARPIPAVTPAEAVSAAATAVDSSPFHQGPDQARAETDTLWFGGIDEGGFAWEGGLWDWDTNLPPGDPLQGWTSIDLTEDPSVYFYRATAADFISHGDACVPAPDSGGMLWCGIHEDDAVARDFVGGMGYGNDMGQVASSPAFPFDPATEAVTLAFQYFNDTEQDYDFTRVYLVGLSSSNPDPQPVLVDELTGRAGSPETPETFTATVPGTSFYSWIDSVRVEIRFSSDGGWSDEDGDYLTECGPFGADDVCITVGETPHCFDFETGAQGWSFEKVPGTGACMTVVPEESWAPWLQMAGVGDCGMESNAVTFADMEGPWSPPGHFAGHEEMAFSNVVPRGGVDPVSWRGLVARVNAFAGGAGLAVRIGLRYFPYTSPYNPTPHWSPRRGPAPWFIGSYSCRAYLEDLTAYLPADWDSVQLVYEVAADLEGRTYGSPMIDDAQIGIVVADPATVEDDAIGARGDALFAIAPILAGRPGVLRFRTAADGGVELALHDLGGRRIATLLSAQRGAGEHAVAWDGDDDAGRRIPPGIYWVRLRTAAGGTAAQRVLVLQ